MSSAGASFDPANCQHLFQGSRFQREHCRFCGIDRVEHMVEKAKTHGRAPHIHLHVWDESGVCIAPLRSHKGYLVCSERLVPPSHYKPT